MRVIKHRKRFLINMSHVEMAALRKVIAFALEESTERLTTLTPGERIAIGHWRGNPFKRRVIKPSAKTLSHVA